LIIHRGPDDEGYYFGDMFAFGHRRLSILDLSKDGHQPMHYLERYTITYNGEVYNYLEIREELINNGYIFHSNTDTEVILASYDKWGKECVNKFNGMWAFAIYDNQKEIIFCSRDRFGIKPFYYTKIDNKFIFGSEIKQLLEFYPQRYVNKHIMMDYLVIGFEDHTNETFFENIYKLEASHNLIYNLKTNNYNIERYYNICKNDNVNNLTEAQSINIYKKKLENSIELRLRSDVKVGTCLSGGLDSSSIATIASKKYNKTAKHKFTAIHAKSTEGANDESKYAKDVEKFSNLNLHIIEPTNNDFLNNIDEIIYTQEEPFSGPSIFMQYFVMKKAKEENCKVMLDGQGGDETLLGYERYYPAYLLDLNFFDALKDFFSVSKNSKLTSIQLLQYIVYFTKYKLRIKRLKIKNKYLKHEYLNIISEDMIEKNSKNYLDIFKLQEEEIFKTQMPHLLKYEDKNSMRNSIETRLPFIDYNVLETALNLNSKLKIKNGWTKYILRKSIENDLPKNIVWRKNKFGFEAPDKSWLDLIDNKMKNSINNSSIINTIANKLDFNTIDKYQKWKLFNIAEWERIYDVQIK
jgi:asparagine synthase (glutamine-hydrolysing)